MKKSCHLFKIYSNKRIKVQVYTLRIKLKMQLKLIDHFIQLLKNDNIVMITELRVNIFLIR